MEVQKDIAPLYARVRELIAAGRSTAYRAVNAAMVGTYWEIGRLIVEEEQQGKTRADYGDYLIVALAKRLTAEFGKGFAERSLRFMRAFYIAYPMRNALRTELTWTHYRLLMRVENAGAREFYETEIINGNWSTRALERQINAHYYERLLASRDRAPVTQEADAQIAAHASDSPRDFVKDPYVLEFLDVAAHHSLHERDLEQLLIDNLQSFMLELGRGFAFVARQQRITAADESFYIDLVFYNYILKCFVLVDLKIGKLTHQDIGQISRLPVDAPERIELERRRAWMSDTEMCVVVSYEAEEETKFDKMNLNIRPHRAKMNRTWGENHETIEDRFRNSTDKFRLVFVCAKWLTGFDAPTVSTLYLDKPMQNHTLMQTIARANRIAPAMDSKGDVIASDESIVNLNERHEKKCGLVLDYIGVFTRLEKALSKYARAQDGVTAHPAEDFDDLVRYLDAAIDEGIRFMTNQNLAVGEIINSAETFKNLSTFKIYADRLSKTDELKKEFSVYQTAITSFYEACKPDILTEELLPESPFRGKYKRTKETFEYLRKIINRKVEDEDNITSAKDKADRLIDESIVSAGYTINSLKEIDLSRIDFERLQQRFKASPYKNLSITDMVDFLKERLAMLLKRNVTRVDLAGKLQDIISNYNTTSSDVEAFFKALREYAERLRDEEKRHAAEGLTEQELEIFDLLFEEHLSEADKKKVKEAAQALLQKLKDNETRRTVLTTDWYKNVQLQRNVEKMIGDVLDVKLPAAYDKPTFNKKQKAVYTHVYNVASRGKSYWV